MTKGKEGTRDVAALVAFIESRQQVPHAIGRQANDCVAFALDAAKAQTGKARAASLKWATRAEGLRIIARFGSLEAAFDHYFERVPPAHAHRGDIAGVADDALGIHPMIVEGDLLVGPGGKGNRRLKRAAMIMAWSATRPQPLTDKQRTAPAKEPRKAKRV